MVESRYWKEFDSFDNTHFCDRRGAEMFTDLKRKEPECKDHIDICQKCAIELWEKERSNINK
jgi:hypothetical protein